LGIVCPESTPLNRGEEHAMARFRIAVLGGDGVGPEVTAEATRVLKRVGECFGHQFKMTEALVGQAAVTAEGRAMSEETMRHCSSSDAVLFGAVGGGAAGDPSDPRQPEHALFRLRKDLGLFANVRPVRTQTALLGASALKREVVRRVDLVVVRELTGGLY